VGLVILQSPERDFDEITTSQDEKSYEASVKSSKCGKDNSTTTGNVKAIMTMLPPKGNVHVKSKE